MLVMPPKGTRLNLRITEDFRQDIESLAAYHGLTLSSYAHSLLVKAIRREREQTPEAFPQTSKSKVVAGIEPSEETKTRRQIEAELRGGPLPAARIKVQREPGKKTGTGR